MWRLTLIVLMSCVVVEEAPPPETSVRCEGFFVCSGRRWDLFPATYTSCISDAQEDYRAKGAAVMVERKCGPDSELHISCISELVFREETDGD